MKGILEMKKKPQTEARANGIAQKLSESGPMAVFDIATLIPILTTLLPSLIACFDPDDGPQAKDYVASRFTSSDADSNYRGYDKRLVKAMARRAKQAGRQEGTRLSWTQAYEAAFVTLDDIRVGDSSTASIAISENHDFLLI
jgi:hypothetical protein